LMSRTQSLAHAAHLTLSEIRTLDSVVHPRPRCNLHGRTRSHALWACAGLLHGRCLPRRCSDWSPMIDVCMHLGVFSVAGHDHNITSSTTTANTTAINRGTAEHRKQIADASSEAERQRKAHAAQGHSHGTPNSAVWDCRLFCTFSHGPFCNLRVIACRFTHVRECFILSDSILRNM
jgi:hypothetical protein